MGKDTESGMYCFIFQVCGKSGEKIARRGSPGRTDAKREATPPKQNKKLPSASARMLEHYTNNKTAPRVSAMDSDPETKVI